MPLSPERGGRRSPPRGGGGGYKVLCVSALHPKASDDVVRDTLYREYKKYGDISVRVMQEPDERVAYVYFRNFEDARDARHSKSRIILFDKPALVEPVYESRAAAPDYGRRRSMSPPPPSHHGPPGGGHYAPHPRYRSRSPVHDRGPPPRDRGFRDYRDDYHPPPPPPPHHRDYGPPRDGGFREHHHHRGGFHGGRGGYRGRGDFHHGGGGYPDRRRENKRDKFPNYLDHIPPEDDPLATRTLFIGNLELNITEEEVRRIFGRYGRLVDIDIKRPPPGTGNAYGFIRYENLDQSYRAKLELSGQYIGKFQCKIGYGKVNATPKVWVGGLGPWCSSSALESEFDRFGAIQKVEYHKGDPHAFIWYETLEAAQAAVGEMRGFPLGGQDRRIRIDYSDVEPGNQQVGGPPPSGGGIPPPRRHYDDFRDGGGPFRGRGNSRYHWSANNGRGGGRGGGGGGDWGPPRGGDFDRGRHRDDFGPGPRGGGGGGGGGDAYGEPPVRRESSLADAKNVSDVCRFADKVWEGGLILKNSLFPCKFHHVEGNPRVTDALKDPETGLRHLKITQRLRLDQSKLDDVSKRMNSSRSHAIFLGVTSAAAVAGGGGGGENPDVQSRPLRNLVSYLKQKEAAGVISMNNSVSGGGGGEGGGAGPGDVTEVLYCFPPCNFSYGLLQREAPGVMPEEGKDDHLVILVVCGNSSG